jgi:hypothetical protein
MNSYLYYSIRNAAHDEPQSMQSTDQLKDLMNNFPCILAAASARAGEIYRPHSLELATLGIVSSLVCAIAIVIAVTIVIIVVVVVDVTRHAVAIVVVVVAHRAVAIIVVVVVVIVVVIVVVVTPSSPVVIVVACCHSRRHHIPSRRRPSHRRVYVGRRQRMHVATQR